MTSSHGRKSRARNKSRRQGAAYAAANAGTLHRHDSGPPNKDLQPADPSRWGVETAPDMRTASALIGARIERCAPCQESLTARLLDDEDPIALAMTAGSVYNLHVIHEPDTESPAAKPIKIFYFLVKHARLHAGDAQLLAATVERMPRADRAALLEAALELWTYYGPRHRGLMRDRGGLSDLTTISDPAAARPVTEAGDQHAAEERPPEGAGPAVRPAASGQGVGRPVAHADRARPLPLHRPTLTTPRKETRIHMSENTENLEQLGEDAARSLIELVTVLQTRGIKYPLEAYRVLSYLTRAAGEMRTALDLLETSVQGLHDRGLLMSDYRGEPLDEVIERFAEASGRARDLAGDLNGNLSKAYSAVGRLAYKEASEGQEPAART
ncbi:hypothetical protein ACFY3M_50500 [Streptomyces mirabilis]|uniref:hypothetical protein n=1 Tax=Streptomyces mirabilis TaxID=68239 RepID=UPI00369D5000